MMKFLQSATLAPRRAIRHPVALILFLALAGQSTLAAPCTLNPVACENLLQGNPPGEWDITEIDETIQGFATDISVNVGETVRFKVKTAAANYRIDIYRVGYYQGLGARLVTTITPSVSLPQAQPQPISDPATGLIDCGNWAESASWPVPPTAVSGLYIGKLVRNDTGGSSHIYFVVRDDAGGSDLLFQTSDTTWQAYNSYGGRSLYDYLGTPNPRAYKVSYNRPFGTRANVQWAMHFTVEYRMIRWLEANGFDVSYTTGVDTHRRGHLLPQHRAFLSVGHDEYWSGGQRANVEAARDAGVHLAFFSGNEIFWKVRWEPSIDGAGTPLRTLVCYKETKANAKIDPHPTWTGTWRDPRFSPPSDGGRPENLLSGTLFRVNGITLNALEVPAAYGAHRFWRNTSVASLAPGQVAVFAHGTLGFEWDEAPDGGPPGLMRLSLTTAQGVPVLRDHGNSYASGQATHSLTLYRHASGALVFGAGSIQLSWGLDDAHGNFLSADVRLQQATVNLFADMGVQPAVLQPGLVPASPSADTTPPSSFVQTPAQGTLLQPGVPITITGTASDASGQVWGVEVSTDGGVTWHSANGRSSWDYLWTSATPGNFNVKSRAFDDSGNVETPSPGAAITVANDQSTLWQPGSVPALIGGHDNPLELGIRFQSALEGAIIGIRFYKAPGNTGSHMGNLWSANGALLASAAFIGESPSGWQQMNFPAPVMIASNTIYVASYHCPRGHYGIDLNYFASGLETPPLLAPPNGVNGANGVYVYSASSAFPSQTYNAANYWVDVAFESALAISTAALPNGIQDVSYSATLAAIGGKKPYTWSITAGSLPPGLALDAATGTISGLPSSQGVFSFVIRVDDTSDPAGKTIPLSITISHSVPGMTIWPDTAVPALPDAGADSALELGTRFRSDADGVVTGVRFYKATANQGRHVANLWSAAGHLLASAVFTSETPSGWQQVDFAQPVPISAGTTYVASYHCPNGHYSIDVDYFASQGVSNPPLRAPADGDQGRNGLYAYSPVSVFPSQTFRAANYWVDVVFHTPLAIATAGLPGGIRDVPYSATLAARGGKQPCSWSVVAGSLPAGMSLDPNTGAIAGIPAAAGTFSFTVQVSDSSNPPESATRQFSVTTYSAPGLTIWPPSAAPAWVDGGADSPVQLGVKFRSDVAGLITGIRFYKSAANTGAHVGSLWTASGELLASAVFTAESSTGWQQADFGTPVPIAANTAYVASYHCPQGHYSVDLSYLAASGVDSPPLHAIANGESGGNGVYSYGPPSAFPANSWGAANYWVDVVLQTPLVITPQTPPNGSVQSPYSLTLNASSGKTPYTWSIASGSLPAGLTLDAASGVISGTPAATGTFNVTVQVADASNPIETATRPFTITIYGTAGFTLGPDTASPAVVDVGSDSPVQLGLKFRSDVDGLVTGIRFYKAAANQGLHVGSLWTSAGQLLASATFDAETQSGWQQVDFATSVPISANTLYVVSYHCPAGHYSINLDYFGAPQLNPPLRAPSSAETGGNGVYAYGASSTFPNQTYRAANYWVDVVFVPVAP